VAVKEMHRDRLPAAWGITRAQLPCILGRAADQTPFVLLSREEIDACRGRVAELERRLLAAVARPVAA
jgi:hypothetical protein